MPTYFFTADHHFSHERIVRYANRPFSSIQEHDEALVRNWNATVASGDSVYFLGDFCFGNKAEQALAFRRRLNGAIFFIEGNHDRAAAKIRSTFAWYDKVKTVKIGDKEFFLSHYAHKVWNKSHYGSIHCYGHSHGSLPDDPNSLSMDVGIDSWAKICRDRAGAAFDEARAAELYRPIAMDEVLEWMKKKTWKPIDHHGRQDPQA
jgi:calcineurin-like phosphoesterase family protein